MRSPVTTVAEAVTALFVPGDRPDRYAKAAGAGADVVIVDLEDAVPAAAKTLAGQAVNQALAPGTSVRALVRVNGSGTCTHEAEVDMLAALAAQPGNGLLGVMLPKAEDPGAVAALVGRLRITDLGLALVPLIESAVGVLAAAEIARVAGVTRLALGAIDLTTDLDAAPESPVVTHAMAHLVLTSRAARVAPPLDSPATAITDTDAVLDAARRARACGFGGKLCIHPAQLTPVRTGFRPTEDEIVWATRVMEAGEAAVQLDGRMIDKPVVERARRVLRRAGRPG